MWKPCFCQHQLPPVTCLFEDWILSQLISTSLKMEVTCSSFPICPVCNFSFFLHPALRIYDSTSNRHRTDLLLASWWKIEFRPLCCQGVCHHPIVFWTCRDPEPKLFVKSSRQLMGQIIPFFAIHILFVVHRESDEWIPLVPKVLDNNKNAPSMVLMTFMELNTGRTKLARTFFCHRWNSQFGGFMKDMILRERGALENPFVWNTSDTFWLTCERVHL